ncbi:uncharacterized protein LOC113271959 [Papaver somniferum]|uniref:uncharacterized protein LOC113271959 n=1 Tax=Papaver somniferum TaxID=3469 RepID=UPI000E704AAE|nr:uncharacterized protein LOC113271959 [Papaver somniferum]
MKEINKEIIKTIKVENDEIIDCYDIYRQPSLSHPLLCNHTIQMRPSSYPKGLKSNELGTLQLPQTWHKYGLYPDETVPIRRKGKNYNPTLLRKHQHPRISPYETQIISPSNSTNDNDEIHEFTETNELSISQIWVADYEHNDINTIEVGWMVHQDLYGDNQTRFFIYWTTDGYMSSGCYNLICNGFVQTTSNISLGCSFSEVSTFNSSQKDAPFSIHKDESSGNWWVQVQGTPVGYYSSSLFTKLSKTTTTIQITNKQNRGQHTSTQMGSGHFPCEGGLKTSSYFNWVQVVDEDNMIKDPENITKWVTNPTCYDLEIDDDHYETNGYGFYFGGPGYNGKCQ